MATLQKIRSKGPLLLIVIGLAMLAFILGDAWKIIRPNQGVQYVGSIDGKNISAMDFQKELENYTEVVKFINQNNDLTEDQLNSIRDEVWAIMVRNNILEKQASALGLTVTDAEIKNIIESGSDPVLSNTPFSGADGTFDSDRLKDFLAFYNELNPSDMSADEYNYYQSLYKYWLFIENDIKSGLLYSKYISLVKGSIVSNPIAAKNSFENRIKRADVLLASLPFNSVSDADVKLTSSDLKKVYAENKEALYTYSENRDIYYIDFEIEPSQADRDALLAEVNEIATQLEDQTGDMAAFLRRSGSEIYYSEVPRSARNLPEDVAERLDSVNVGGVFGPYYNADDDTYNAFKYIASVNGYDSIQVKLMQVVLEDEAAAQKRVDSILTALKKGASFDAIAQSYSQTATEQWIAADTYEPAVINGDNAAYLNKINSMKKGETASLEVAGGIIIINVIDTKTPLKKYDLAIVKRPVEFSDETSNNAYNKLSLFVAQNNTIDLLKENAEDSDFRLLYYPGFESYSYNVGGVSKSHEALRWIFDANQGEVSRIFEVGAANDHLLVVAVDKIHPRGYRTVEDATASLSLKAIKEKKSDVLKGQLAGLSFDQIKAVPNVNIDTVKFLNFTNSAYISSSFSNEPTIGGSVMNLEQGVATLPMTGENCVYVAEKISADEYTGEFDEKAEKARLQTISVSQIPGRVLDALYYEAKVVDNRYKIF